MVPASATDGTEKSRRRQAEKRLRRYVILWLSVCLFFVVYGVYQIWDGTYRLPHQYERLRTDGIRVTATFRGCGLQPLGRVIHCRLSLRFEGRVRSWIYPENHAQFRGLQAGSPVPVLVDPSNPKTVYTVTDVEHGTNTGGAKSVLLWLGVAFIGVLGL